MNEVWKPVVGYDGLYEVSDYGRVRAMFESWNGRYKSGRILVPLKHPHGYSFVNLYYPGSKQLGRSRTIHSLVLEAFVGPRPYGNDVRHLDGNKKNNHLDNLKWGTRTENVGDAISHGTWVHGEKCHFAKLTKDSVLKIREMWKSGVNSTKIAMTFNISKPQAWRIANGKSWSRT